jgi:hypothetical protein
MFGQALFSIEEKLNQAAMDQIQSVTTQHYSGPQLLAMKEFTKLQLMNSFDLAGVVLRGRILETIEQYNLWNEHPEQFRTLEEAAQAYNISVSMLCDIRTMYKYVFPKLAELEIDIPGTWNEVGLSNMRELNPILKALITGEEPEKKSVKEKVNKLLDDVKATAAASGQDLTDEELVNEAITHALTLGRDSNAGLRKSLTMTKDRELILTAVLRKNGTRYVVSEVDEDQYSLLLNVAGKFMDVIEFDCNAYRPAVNVLESLMGRKE